MIHLPLILAATTIGWSPSSLSGSLGTNYCVAAPNATGMTGVMSAVGSDLVADNDLMLIADDVPANATGFFVVGSAQGFVMNAGGGAGNLCVAGQLGRYRNAGQVQSSGLEAQFMLQVDLTQTPSPSGSVAILPGETWNFQVWHREVTPTGGATFNFSDGLSIQFR